MALHTISMLLLLFISSAIADTSTDCTTQLSSIAPCLDFVQNKANAPTPSCCNGAKVFVTKDPSCICQLLASGSSVPGLTDFNETRVEQLPALCSIKTSITASSCKTGSSPSGGKSPSAPAQPKSPSGNNTNAGHASWPCLWSGLGLATLLFSVTAAFS